MEKHLKILMALLLVTGAFTNCKKEDNAITRATQEKDYTPSISNKTWWGILTNAGEQPQYYSVHFNANNTLLWSQFSGDYSGGWSVDKNKLTMIFTNPSVVVTADVTDDKLKNITTNTANKVNTGELVENPNRPLDNTTWMGSAPFANPQTMQLTFLPGSKVQTKIGNQTFSSGVYTRSGGVIRYTVPMVLPPIFCVITSGEGMNGCYYSAVYSWQLAKQ